MSFHRYGKTVKFPLSEHVDIHVRDLTLNADAPEDKQVQTIEIRQFIRAGEVYGHGVIIPARGINDLRVALDQLEKVRESA